MKKTRFIIYLKILLLSNILCWHSFAQCIFNDFEGWKDCFIKEKLSSNLSSFDLDTFSKAQYIEKVIKLDKNQPEHKMHFHQYLGIIGIKEKITKGMEFFSQNKAILGTICGLYDVNPEAVVALIGMESDYGTRAGNFNVIDALSTLSYEGRRREFFEKELLKLLVIAVNDNLQYENLKGSWAGAMGQIQFMPSSYAAYAVDYDEDGVADIWHSTQDVIASAANYLKSNGWKKDYGVYFRPVELKDVPKSCSLDEKRCIISDARMIVFTEGEGGKLLAYEVSKNFDIIMKWNRSQFFALSVMNISNKIKL